jgi:hypothetical protein
MWAGSQVVRETILQCLSWLYLILEYTHYKQYECFSYHLVVAFGWQHHLISSDGLTTISLQTCVELYISYMARDRSFLSDIHNSELTMYDDHECHEVL